jgi:two-component system, OmpR family, phosphate regulon sensor histidine kinase PhoR
MIDLNAVRFVIPDMKEYGVLVVLHDVSFQSELDKLRKDFVANASHEIKTPITAIKGYLETIIEDDEISKTLQKKFIGNAYIQVERLAVLSEQLMDLSRSERILQQEPYVQCDLSVLCEEICRQYQQKIPDSLSLQCECPDGITVNTDVYVVRQIVENLLDNAIKYTFYGKILLRLNDYKEEVTISVNDTGIGIETAEQEKIWDRFYRVDTSHNSEIKGHGLGLSIVKHLAKRLGANINVESTFGEGSTFTLSIPTSR